MNQVLYQASHQETDRSGGLRVGQAREPLLGFVSGKKKKGLLLLSNLLLAVSLTGLMIYYWPVVGSEIGYFINSKFKIKNEQIAKIINSNDNLEIMPQINGGNRKNFIDILTNSWQTDALAAINAPDSEFSIVIPKISASAKVIANVNAADAKAYNEALRQGVAHAAGSVLPGMKGTTYLFAHSTDGPWNIRRYNAIFYLLKELTAGDEIVVFFEGKKYFYTVINREVKDPTDTHLFSQKEEELLALQTCWPPGTVKQVLLVTAKRK